MIPIDFTLSFDFLRMLVRFVILMFFSWIIIDRLYFRKSHRRDFYFTFLLTSVAIFFLVYFMIFCLEDLKGKTSIGIGIGLFGIFSIMRFRTDTMPVREMTYLFTIISLAVVNAVAASVSLAELIVTDVIIVLVLWICESKLKIQHSKLVQYDRIALITPDKRQELIADLEKRLGLKVLKVEVGGVDMLKDMAVLRVYYESNDEKGHNSVNESVKIRQSELLNTNDM